MQNTQLPKEEKDAARKEREEHIERVVGEKQGWHARMKECLRPDADSLAIFLDGMDQDKTDIPRWEKQLMF